MCVCVCVCVRVSAFCSCYLACIDLLKTGLGTPYLHNKHDQLIYPVAGQTHTHTESNKNKSPSVNDVTQMSSQGPRAPLKDKAHITVDKGVLQGRESQLLHLGAGLTSDRGFIIPLSASLMRGFLQCAREQRPS